MDVTDAKINAKHWREIPPCYEFHLQWSNAIPVGQRFVLVVVYTSPFSERKSDQHVFVAGE